MTTIFRAQSHDIGFRFVGDVRHLSLALEHRGEHRVAHIVRSIGENAFHHIGKVYHHTVFSCGDGIYHADVGHIGRLHLVKLGSSKEFCGAIVCANHVVAESEVPLDFHIVKATSFLFGSHLLGVGVDISPRAEIGMSFVFTSGKIHIRPVSIRTISSSHADTFHGEHLTSLLHLSRQRFRSRLRFVGFIFVASCEREGSHSRHKESFDVHSCIRN